MVQLVSEAWSSVRMSTATCIPSHGTEVGTRKVDGAAAGPSDDVGATNDVGVRDVDGARVPHSVVPKGGEVSS